MPGAPTARDLTRTTLAVLFLALLIGASLWVVRPFLPALVWATMLVVATWPVMRGAQAVLWGRRALAVAAMTIAMFVVFAIPLLLGIATLAERAPDLKSWSEAASSFTVPAPPGWVADLPLVGARLAGRWQQVAELPRDELAQRLTPYVRPTVRWLVRQVGGFGMLIVHVVLTGILSAFLYARGEAAVAGLVAFARRLAGERGERAVYLAGGAIRGVALGVVGTAFVQSALAGLGIAVAGVSYAGLLTVLMFVCGVAQIGPTPILLGAVAWLYWQGSTGPAVALFLWTVLVGTLDNVLRPLLIRRGLDLPLLLIFAGVLGGILGFGVIGLFIGPVLLAVTWTLLVDWVREPAAAIPASSEPPAI